MAFNSYSFIFLFFPVLSGAGSDPGGLFHLPDHPHHAGGAFLHIFPGKLAGREGLFELREVSLLARHEEIAATGVFMEYDTITLFQFHNNADELRMLRHMADKGFLDQILISTDPETDRMKAYGSKVGIDYILEHFIPLMQLCGFSAEEIEKITRINPARALCIG